MKNRRTLFVLALGLLILLAGSAQAYWKTDEVFCIAGQDVRPDYEAIEKSCRLTEWEGYTVEYQSHSDKLTVDADGTCHISADAAQGEELTMVVTYTPQGSSKDYPHAVCLQFQVKAPLGGFVVEPSEIYALAGQVSRINFKVKGITKRKYEIVSITNDSGLAEVKFSYENLDYNPCYTLDIGDQVGEGDIIFHSFDGQQAVLHIKVLERPNKVELASDAFTCYVGDTIDLGLDLGNGPDGPDTVTTSATLKDGMGASVEDRSDFLLDANRRFHAVRSGYYTLTIAYYNDYSATATITVYDRETCASLQLSGSLYPERGAVQVLCYDAAGNEIVRPMRIIEGADIATLTGCNLSVTGTGKVTIKVTNEDGSTVTQTFEALANPTKFILNAEELTLEIGQTFDLKVSFDNGEVGYSRYIYYDETYPEDGMHCIRMEGDRIIAQKPGYATICYNSNLTPGVPSMTAECKVVVLESDKKIHMVVPTQIVGVGESVKFSVQDETGKEYPATFTGKDHQENYLVYPDGTLTGLEATDYCTVYATLDDGRMLYANVIVRQKPKWLKHDGVTGLLEDHYLSVGFPDSDVGKIRLEELTISVEDETIARVEGHGLIPLRAGSTMVTLQSIYTDAAVTFPVEFISEEELFAGSTSVRVPYGYGVMLPQYSDASGNPVTLDWTITYDVPGEGNSESSGFLLEDGAIICTWPTAKCVVTGKTKDKITVRINVSGYLLPESITVSPNGGKIDGQASFQVLPEQEGTEVNRVYWIVEDENIVTCDAVTDSDTNVLYGKQAGETRVMAMLDNGVYTVFDVVVASSWGQHMKGDANSDETLDAQDALLVMQYVAGWGVNIDHYDADVNANGYVDVEDALLILQKAAGMNVLLRSYEQDEE